LENETGPSTHGPAGKRSPSPLEGNGVDLRPKGSEKTQKGHEINDHLF
jgi:hypothetical protein